MPTARPILFLLAFALLGGCGPSSADAEKKAPVALELLREETLPTNGDTPEEILKQLMEGNARFVHGEPRSPGARAARGPIAAIVRLCPRSLPAEQVFDQPAGGLQVIDWNGDAGAAQSLERGLRRGIRAVILVGEEDCPVPGRSSTAQVSGDGPLVAVAETIRAASPALSEALRAGRCRMIGAVYQPGTGRIRFIGQDVFNL